MLTNENISFNEHYLEKFRKTDLVFNQNGFKMKEFFLRGRYARLIVDSKYIFDMNFYLPNRRLSGLICKIFSTV